MIQRDLINYIWLFNEEDKNLVLKNKETNEHFVLDKVRMFSLFRFLIRVSEAMIIHRRKVEKKANQDIRR